MGTHYQGAAVEIRALDTYIKLMRASETITLLMNKRLIADGLIPNKSGPIWCLGGAFASRLDVPG